MRFGLFLGAAVLSTTAMLPSLAVAGTVDDLLDRAELRTGAIFSPTGTFIQFVFVPGLNELWELDQSGQPAKRASVTVVGDAIYVGPQGDEARSVWNMSDTADLIFSGKTSPLVGQVIDLLAGTLAQDHMGLPKGSRFGGQYAILDDKGQAIGQWSLNQEEVVVSQPDKPVQSVPLTDLLTQITPAPKGESK